MRVALVHDYLTQHGGAERVLAALHGLYPEAPVFTSFHDPGALPPEWAEWDIRTSQLAALPGVNRYHRALLPLYPAIFRAFGRELARYDLVLADSSAWSHHAPARVGAVHVCYCHSPARFLWGDPNYLGPARVPGPLRLPLAAVSAALRPVDRRAAGRVGRYVANSRAVAERVRAVYGIEAPVVYPPVDVERFAPGPGGSDLAPEAYYVVLSRLVPHKRVDLAVDAFARLGLPLKVIGAGRAEADLRRRAGPTVEFLGRLDDGATTQVLARARGLVLPAVEDFGITAVEAQAAGRPVVALAAGGALESVVDGETGVLFPEATVESLVGAVRVCEGRAWDAAKARANAARFGAERFKAEMAAVVDRELARAWG